MWKQQCYPSFSTTTPEIQLSDSLQGKSGRPMDPSLEVQRFNELPSVEDFATQIEPRNVPAVIFSNSSQNSWTSLLGWDVWITLLFWFFYVYRICWKRFFMVVLKLGKLVPAGILLVAASTTCRLTSYAYFVNFILASSFSLIILFLFHFI